VFYFVQEHQIERVLFRARTSNRTCSISCKKLAKSLTASRYDRHAGFLYKLTATSFSYVCHRHKHERACRWSQLSAITDWKDADEDRLYSYCWWCHCQQNVAQRTGEHSAVRNGSVRRSSFLSHSCQRYWSVTPWAADLSRLHTNSIIRGAMPTGFF